MRALAYGRISTEDQQVDGQTQQLKDYAARQNWELVDVITDIASGGKAAAERHGLGRVFEMAHRREFDVLLFWSLDRLSREGVRETLAYLTKLDDAGIKWHSFTEPYLSSLGIFSDAIIAILGALAKQERVRISERTKLGLKRARKTKQLGRPKTDPAKIAKAKRLRHENGYSYTEIGKAMGLSRGRAWQLCQA